MELSNSLRVQLTDLETEHQEFTEKLESFEPRAISSRLLDTRRFVEAQLRNLQSLWTGEARLVRAEIAKHVEKITLAPEGRVYIASGTWDLLGSVAVRLVPGARHERIATSASPSRSRHRSFGCYEMCACTVQAFTETAWPAKFSLSRRERKYRVQSATHFRSCR
jgi:hypothetical protein